MNSLFWLVMARVGGLFAGAPIFATTALPARYRILMAAVLSASMIPAVQSSAVPMDTQTLLAAMLGEFTIGMAFGLLARVLVGAFQLAGTVMGYQMGLAMARSVDPTSGTENATLGSLYMNMATIVFLLLDGHHVLIRSVAASYEVFPVGTALRSDVISGVLLDYGGRMWDLGARVAAPVTGLMLLINGIMGFLNRVNPQFSIFNIGFPLTLASGLIALGISVPGTVDVMLRSFDGLTDAALDLLSP